ncbi:DNA topoisomerase (ATP-hydrolyzing) subunit B [candidate division WOR-3 bacterium]|uniref:DNA gyrase subunit B n=1 Tax=candidate division WOR-3 bacterium TaxID=2052148 RepID=A0A660SLY5_UNCW3|nr:MAG: DNA topoisomerase (ATP-hydrolyzing) subunit B [candidate division WOR-3 bacterium]
MADIYDSSKITVLKGLEAVRRRPAMYVGDVGIRGLHHLIFEVVDNAIDEALSGNCKHIWVTLFSGEIVSIEDDGSGIPVDPHPKYKKSGLELVMTTLHAGAKFDTKVYQISGGLHGVGVSAVNALCEFLEAEVYRGGKIYYQRYERGRPVTRVEVKGKTKKRGTKITFRPDDKIFKKVKFDNNLIAMRLRELAYLNQGLRIEFDDKRIGRKEVYQYKGGIVEFVQFLDRTRKPIIKPIYISGKKNGVEVEIALEYNESYQENIFSYANTINTHEGGYHLAGFKLAMTRTLNDYARRRNLVKEGQSFTGEDVREGLTAVISVKLKDPQFEGQTKTKLGNSEVRGIVDSITSEGLSTYLEEHPRIGSVIIGKVLTAAKSREAARKAKELTRKKSLLESADLPGKLADCTSNDPSECELFIVEGDSAGGSAKQARNREFQAVLPLRGKILNVEKASMAKILSNKEIRSIITALGVGVDEWDGSKLRYHKIIIMTDADVDGAHIRTLLLTYFYRFLKEAIEAGHLYIAQPPLYRVKKGKNEYYCYSDEELDELKKKLGDGIEIQRYKGLGEMNPEQLWKTTMDPERRIIKRVTLEDAARADQIFSILMGDEVQPRKEFIVENAALVENLDI